jgi:hypothetical protein
MAFNGIPIFGPIIETGLYDPHDAPAHSNWCPFNPEAAELASCVEACKQALALQPIFGRGASDRAWTLLATPVLSLGEHTLPLRHKVARQDRSTWPPSDREAFKSFPRHLERQLQRLRPLRNKLGAHCDSDALRPGGVSDASPVDLVLPPLGTALSLVILALNHKATFGYYRLPDPSKPFEVQITVEYPIATLLQVGSDGRPVRVLAFGLSADPRREAAEVVRKAIEFHNELAAGHPRHAQITLSEYADDAAHEKLGSGEFETRII